MVDIVLVGPSIMDTFKMHPICREEIAEACGEEPDEVMRRALPHCVSFVAKVDGKAVCLYGLSGDSIFMVIEESVVTLPVAFFKTSRRVVQKWIQEIPTLHSYIYHKNIFSLKWAKFVGFTLGEPEVRGVNGGLFIPYFVGGEHHVS